MITKSWLLPFMHDVDQHAIEQVVQLAAWCDAELRPVALLPVEYSAAEESVRLEYQMQANDFFEVVRRKAGQRQVAVECHQICTGNVVQCVTLLAQELRCSSVVVLVYRQQGVLLATSAVKELLLTSTVPLMLVRPLEQRSRTRIRPSYAWFQRRLWQRRPVLDVPATQQQEAVASARRLHASPNA